MAELKDTLLRQLITLQLIPRLPQKIATTTLQEKLEERGFSVTLRSLQRDLKERLSMQFPLNCDESERPFRWSFNADAQFSLPGLDTPTALTLHLAQEHLRTLLPSSVADLLNPQFKAAEQHLQSLTHNGLAHWANIVRAIPNGKTLIPAPVDTNIWRVITEALLNKQQIKVSYLSRQQGQIKNFMLHPTGLVSRYSVSYLIARVEGYDNLRHFALHRMKKVVLLGKEAITPQGFDIDSYIKQGAFSLHEGHNIKLVADIDSQLAWILKETPLSKKQKIAPIENSDWLRLEAEVPKDQETFWWLCGLSARIRVHEPQEWVDDIKSQLQKLQHLYQ